MKTDASECERKVSGMCVTGELYKFEPCLEVSEFSKIVPDDRRDGMISILILEWFVIILSVRVAIRCRKAQPDFSWNVSPKSPKSKDNPRGARIFGLLRAGLINSLNFRPTGLLSENKIKEIDRRGVNFKYRRQFCVSFTCSN